MHDLDPAVSKLIHFQVVVVVVVVFNLLKWILVPSGRSTQTISQNEMCCSQDCPESVSVLGDLPPYGDWPRNAPASDRLKKSLMGKGDRRYLSKRSQDQFSLVFRNYQTRTTFTSCCRAAANGPKIKKSCN